MASPFPMLGGGDKVLSHLGETFQSEGQGEATQAGSVAALARRESVLGGE